MLHRLRKSFSNGHSAFLLALGLLMLSAAVFGWGLQYKLSLYQGRDSITHQMPEAKFFPRKNVRLLYKRLAPVRPAYPLSPYSRFSWL